MRAVAAAGLAVGCLAALAMGLSCRKSDPAARVRAVADEYWAAYVERHPEIATFQGLAKAPHDRLTDNSLQALQAWRKREDAWLAELRTLEERLRPAAPERAAEEGRGRGGGGAGGGEAAASWLLAATAREALEASVAVRVCRTELWNVSDTWSGWQQFMADWIAAQPVGSPEGRQAALARWGDLPRFIDVEIANLREGLKQGVSAPRGTARQVIRQIDGLLAAGETESPLLEPARRDSDPAFAAALAAVVDSSVRPALRRYRDFLEAEYAPAARDEIGVSALPDGAACYAACVRAHTTLDLDARQVHEIGLAEMSRIQEEMKGIAERSFRTSDVPALLERLRTDPQHTYRSREDLILHVTAALERARAAMPRWFGRVPKAGVVIQPQPAYREPTADQYNSPAEDGSRPGVYLISTWEPRRKSRCGPESTAFHETIPGHHLQTAIAMERRDLHPIQRFTVYDPSLRYNGAYGEGWALYAERLADEMGLFSSDLDRLGMLSQQAWRAARLVVDPGIHVLGWSREQAVEYMIRHTTGSRPEIEAEVDRYIAWPGQAVGYMIGALEIRRLREAVERRLGPRFDIRRFHDRILEDGGLPMAALRRKIENWAAAEETR
jgi:uncharacterized protein (DUF885 family)